MSSSELYGFVRRSHSSFPSPLRCRSGCEGVALERCGVERRPRCVGRKPMTLDRPVLHGEARPLPPTSVCDRGRGEAAAATLRIETAAEALARPLRRRPLRWRVNAGVSWRGTDGGRIAMDFDADDADPERPRFTARLVRRRSPGDAADSSPSSRSVAASLMIRSPKFLILIAMSPVWRIVDEARRSALRAGAATALYSSSPWSSEPCVDVLDRLDIIDLFFHLFFPPKK